MTIPLVLLTDRTSLDRQLTSTFRRCLDETVQHADNVKQFSELLQRNSSDIISGMLQKMQKWQFVFTLPVKLMQELQKGIIENILKEFAKHSPISNQAEIVASETDNKFYIEDSDTVYLIKKDKKELKVYKQAETFGELNPSSKIVLLVDEAHRTQYKALGTNLNTALPNAPKIAFTGTPLIKSQKTVNEFGSYIDTYTIEQAVADGATVRILYEGREAQSKIQGKSLDVLFDSYFSDRTIEEKEAIKSKYGTKNAILAAEKRIESICKDIVEHYTKKIQPDGFKAIIVTSSRLAAIRYKETLDSLNAPESQVIISGSQGSNDPLKKYIKASTEEKKNMLKQYTEHSHHIQYIERFKHPEDPLSFLIVKDMLLTGFDAPILQAMYLDRKLLDHSLLQAIARVNRTYHNKDYGIIVDYYGLADYLDEALRLFSKQDIRGTLVNIKEELPKLENFHKKVMSYFPSKDIEECVLALEDSETRDNFRIDWRNFLRCMNTIMPDKAAAPYIKDMQFVARVYIAVRNHYREEQLNIADCGKKVQKLIDDHLYAQKIDTKIPEIDLFSDDFRKRVSSFKTIKGRASEIEHAIRHYINIHLDEDPEYYKKLSERLNQILEQYQDNWEKLYQVLFEFKDNMELQYKDEAKELGLTETEYAFYNIIVSEISQVQGEEVAEAANTFNTDLVQQELQELTKDLVNIINSTSGVVDFFRRESEKKNLRRQIKHRLLDTQIGEHHVARNRIIDRFMHLAQVKFEQ